MNATGLTQPLIVKLMSGTFLQIFETLYLRRSSVFSKTVSSQFSLNSRR